MAQQTLENGVTHGTNRTRANENFTELYSDKAPLASPTFTGTPAAPTAAAGTSTAQIATTAFVMQPRNNGYCLVSKSADQTAQNLSGFANLTFNTDVSDDDGLHDTVSNTDRLVIPAAWDGRMIEVGCRMHLSNETGSASVLLQILRGGAAFIGSDAATVNMGGYVDAHVSVRTAPILAVSGHVYTFNAHTSDVSVTIESESTYAWARVVD